MDKFVTKAKRKVDSESSKNEIKRKKEETTFQHEEYHGKPFSESLRIPTEVFQKEEEFEDRFTKLADFLLNEVVLMVNNKPHRLVELEFYYTSAKHFDPFTHQDSHQAHCGKWYFHRTGGKYRTGNYKGLDIAFGNSESEKGGILIRSIENLSTRKVICGPCKSVDHILEVCEVGSINDLVDSKMKKNIDVDSPTGSSPLYLKIDKTLLRKTALRSARVGIHMTKRGVDPELQKRFVYRHYRYFIHPKEVFKGKNLMVLALHTLGKSKAEIAAQTFATDALIAKNLELFEQGKKEGNPDRFLGKKLEDNEIAVCMGALASKPAEKKETTAPSPDKTLSPEQAAKIQRNKELAMERKKKREETKQEK